MGIFLCPAAGVKLSWKSRSMAEISSRLRDKRIHDDSVMAQTSMNHECCDLSEEAGRPVVRIAFHGFWGGFDKGLFSRLFGVVMPRYDFEVSDQPVVNGALVVLYHNHLEKLLEAVKMAGGTIVKQIFSFPGGRRFHFKDPSGNELAVWSE